MNIKWCIPLLEIASAAHRHVSCYSSPPSNRTGVPEFGHKVRSKLLRACNCDWNPYKIFCDDSFNVLTPSVDHRPRHCRILIDNYCSVESLCGSLSTCLYLRN
ncbi:hypothetical protein QTP88_007357 [Uroleucon formosanum]